MRTYIKQWLMAGLTVCFCMPALAAQNHAIQAAAAMATVMKGEDIEIIHSEVLPDGVVDILFGVTVTDYDYDRVVGKLKSHPDIKGVIGRTSPRNFCRFD
jgi:acyl-CoA reductase-like NAD-dependent aldehyde dehydrogenase